MGGVVSSIGKTVTSVVKNPFKDPLKTISVVAAPFTGGASLLLPGLLKGPSAPAIPGVADPAALEAARAAKTDEMRRRYFTTVLSQKQDTSSEEGILKNVLGG